jgi:hypothetical protein
MSGNASPIWTKNGHIGSILVTAGNTSSQGGGTIATDIFKAFTSDSTNGSLIKIARWIPTATAPTLMTASVGRLFLSSVTAGATTSANTFLIDEVVLPAIAADNAATAVSWFDRLLNYPIDPGWTLLATNHVAPGAGTAWRLVAIGGDY